MIWVNMRRGLYLSAILVVIVFVMAACADSAGPLPQQGPVLVQENTLEPTIPVPTRQLSATPTRLPATSEVQSPLEVVTVQADFVLVTPTLPPSKTPTTTPTITQTPTVTPTPTVTVTATATRPLFPTSVIIPVTNVVPEAVDRICDSQWFFIEPRPDNCPMAAPTASQGVFQTFEHGFMVWLGTNDMIYTLYIDSFAPQWQTFRDGFDEAMPHDSEQYAIAPNPNLYQPRRGFGLLWRENQAVRERIGWGAIEWEVPYSVQTQTAADGTLYVSDPYGGVFALFPNGSGWQRYAGYAGFTG